MAATASPTGATKARRTTAIHTPAGRTAASGTAAVHTPAGCTVAFSAAVRTPAGHAAARRAAAAHATARRHVRSRCGSGRCGTRRRRTTRRRTYHASHDPRPGDSTGYSAAAVAGRSHRQRQQSRRRRVSASGHWARGSRDGEQSRPCAARPGRGTRPVRPGEVPAADGPSPPRHDVHVGPPRASYVATLTAAAVPGPCTAVPHAPALPAPRAGGARVAYHPGGEGLGAQPGGGTRSLVTSCPSLTAAHPGGRPPLQRPTRLLRAASWGPRRPHRVGATVPSSGCGGAPAPRSHRFYRACGLFSTHRRVTSANDCPPRSQRCRLALRPKCPKHAWSHRWSLERRNGKRGLFHSETLPEG